jgi:photosystem II stability/assembly factor-like uncharacterized protein
MQPARNSRFRPLRSTALLTRVVLLGAAALLTLIPPAWAGAGVWTPLGPEGGTVTVLAASPSDPRIVFAGTPNGGVFKSTSGGSTWTSASTGLGDSDGFPPIASFAIAPRRPSLVYAGTHFHGAFRSVDGGLTWAPCGGFPTVGVNARVSALEVDPLVANTVYAATPDGVLRSRDGGRSWTPRSFGLPAGTVLALAFDPAGRYLYAGLQGAGVYRSPDQGGRWERANAGLPPLVQALGFDPRSPSVVFAGTSHGLYRSVDRGRHWTRVATELITRFVLGVGFQSSTDTAFAATRDGIFRSADRGVTWNLAPGALPNPPSLSFAIGEEALLAGSFEDRRGGGVARSTDGGTSWRISNRGLSTLRLVALAFHPTEPSTLYASAGLVGLFKSRDGGATWTHLPLAPSDPAIQVEGVALEPTAPDTVYAGTSAGALLLRSDDAGATWRSVGPPNAQLIVIEPDRRSPGALWTGGFGSAYQTPDGGDTWNQVVLAPGIFPSIFDIEVDPSLPSTITFAGSLLIGPRVPHPIPILYRSESGGTNWTRIATDTLPGGAVLHFATDRRSPSVFYAVTEGGLYRTENQGAVWKKLLESVVRPGDVVAQEEAIYASRGASVLRSTDQGEIWSPIRQGLGARAVERLWIDPRDSGHLFAGTQSSGLWEYTIPPAPRDQE